MMQFTSYTFILGYLPVLIVGYFVFNRKSITVGKIFMLIGSTVFYIYGGRKIAAVMGVSIAVNLIFSYILNKITKKKPALFLNIAANISLLFYFKYYSFFLENINAILGQEYTFKYIALPLGISFFTFQQIMYVVNVYRGDIQKVCVLDYLVYVLYFPKLLMGPIVEPSELICQFQDSNRKNINWDNISYGLKLFSFGIFKKMILADTFATAVNWGYSNIEISTAMDWFLIMLSYTFEIYFDFSGYSDMAVGISKMLNIDLPVNFDSPYKALSIRDFWRRWHISLTGFWTRYVYIPLGGSRKGKIRTYINTMIVFLVSGIWHGANWTFILWGGIHGLLNVADRILEKRKRNLFEVVKWCGTFLAVNVLWLLFRSESIEQWWSLIKKMLKFQNMAVSDGLIHAFVLPETSFILKLFHLDYVNVAVRGFSLLVFVVFSYGLCLIPENNYKKQSENNWRTMLTAAIAFVWSFLCLSRASVFVYNNF